MHKTSITDSNMAKYLSQQFFEVYRGAIYYITMTEFVLKEGKKEEAEELATSMLDELKAWLENMHYTLYGEWVRIRETKETRYSEWDEMRWGKYIKLLKAILERAVIISINIHYYFYDKADTKKAEEGAKVGYNSLLGMVLTLHNMITGEGVKSLIIK